MEKDEYYYVSPFDFACKAINNLRFGPSEFQIKMELSVLRVGMRGCDKGLLRCADLADTLYVDQQRHAKEELLKYLDDSQEADIVRKLVETDRTTHVPLWLNLRERFEQRHHLVSTTAPNQGRHASLQ